MSCSFDVLLTNMSSDTKEDETMKTADVWIRRVERFVTWCSEVRWDEETKDDDRRLCRVRTAWESEENAPSPALVGVVAVDGATDNKNVVFNYAYQCAKRGMIVLYICEKKHFYNRIPSRLLRDEKSRRNREEASSDSSSCHAETLSRIRMKYMSNVEEIQALCTVLHMAKSSKDLPDVIVVDGFCDLFRKIPQHLVFSRVARTVAMLRNAAIFARSRRDANRFFHNMTCALVVCTRNLDMRRAQRVQAERHEGLDPMLLSACNLILRRRCGVWINALACPADSKGSGFSSNRRRTVELRIGRVCVCAWDESPDDDGGARK